ncbi:MAG: NUDIX domain-containing protein, partial [Myxococcota bacterium]
ETDQDALARELAEEMAIKIEVGDPAIAVTHEYEAYVIDFRVYRCRLLTDVDAIRKIGVHDFRLVKPSELDDYEFPGADQATIDSLLASE